MLRKACTNNNIVAALGLLAIIILGQSTVFDWLIDTIPGRIVMIGLILGISYMNNTLGVVAVLLIIIMFNQSEIALFEGFTSDASCNRTDSSCNIIDPSCNRIDPSCNITDPSGNRKHHRKGRVTKVTEDSSKNILLMDASGNIKASVKNYLDGSGSTNSKQQSTSTHSHSNNMHNRKGTDTTTEGFDNMLDMEDSIKRGKPSDSLSNQVPDPRNIDTSEVQAYSGFSTSTYSSM
jgi:uncharacterized membrane protein